MVRTALWLLVVMLAALLPPGSVLAADYTGPLIDAHSHVPSATAIDAYVAAMKRHRVTKVVLLGVGAVQKQDAAWIGAAARKYPDLVIAGLPLGDPTPQAAARLDGELAKSKARVVGEAHVRQVSRKIDRSPADAGFVKVLQVCAKHGVPVVVHDELDDAAAGHLEKALAAVPAAIIVLAHGGEAKPTVLEGLLARHDNLRVDLSGMHFQRTPALATEKGPLDPAWKALIDRRPDRFMMGVDVWAARLFEPAMLDRLMTWTRRVLGELSPEAAERVAYRNAAALYHAE